MSEVVSIDDTTFTPEQKERILQTQREFYEADARAQKIYAKMLEEQKALENATYTLFASGLNNGGRNVELKNKNTTTDIAILFDVVEEHTYSRSVNKTQYAAENKVNYSDHAVIEDGKFSFSARVNSSPTVLIQNNYVDKDTDPQNPLQSKRPGKALDILNKLIQLRKIVTLVTEDKILENYILTSMSAKRSGSDGDALVFDLEFTEFRTFILGKTVLATNFSDAKKSGKKQKGAVQSSATKEDIQFKTRQTKFAGKAKDSWQSLSDSLGSGNFTKEDVVSGVITPDGKIKGTDGSIIDYKKAVGN